MNPEIRCIKLDAITTTAGTQIRSSVNTDVVGEYADSMMDATNKFPPVVVFQTGDNLILADGFHRVMAAIRNGFKDILADVRPGGRADALWYALTANRSHGLQLTKLDKKRIIILALENFPGKSQQEIANHVGCAQSYVASVKRDVITTDNVATTRTDSKGRVQPTSKPRKASPPPSSSDPDEPEPTTTTVVEGVKAHCPNAKTSSELADWYSRAPKNKRGEFLNHIFNWKEVVVKDKAEFKKRIDWWLDHLVSERKPAP